MWYMITDVFNKYKLGSHSNGTSMLCPLLASHRGKPTNIYTQNGLNDVATNTQLLHVVETNSSAVELMPQQHSNSSTTLRKSSYNDGTSCDKSCTHYCKIHHDT